MSELGVDVSKEFPKPMTDEVVQAADAVITMGCGDACPIYPGKRYEDWEVADPAEADLDGVRRIRDDIASACASCSPSSHTPSAPAADAPQDGALADPHAASATAASSRLQTRPSTTALFCARHGRARSSQRLGRRLGRRSASRSTSRSRE